MEAALIIKSAKELVERQIKLDEEIKRLSALSAAIALDLKLILMDSGIDGVDKIRGNYSKYVMSVCAKVCQVSVNDIAGKLRNKNIARARHLYLWLMTKKTSWSLNEIGSTVDRDHATVIHSKNKIESEIELYSIRKIKSLDLAVVALQLEEEIQPFDPTRIQYD